MPTVEVDEQVIVDLERARTDADERVKALLAKNDALEHLGVEVTELNSVLQRQSEIIRLDAARLVELRAQSERYSHALRRIADGVEERGPGESKCHWCRKQRDHDTDCPVPIAAEAL